MIRAGIVGLGNIGRGVRNALAAAADFEIVAVFTRRSPEEVEKELDGIKAVSLSDIKDYVGKIDVLLLCGGSKSDLPVQGPELAQLFNTVDSFDTHADIPAYLEKVAAQAAAGGTTSVISSGWDPGLFSMARLMFGSFLAGGESVTFWGKGVSQGHSDAIRRIDGVRFAIQYTVPIDTALQAAREGRNPGNAAADRHTRVCYVVSIAEAENARIEQEIKTMPNYFADYDTTVHFISEAEFKQNHALMPHGGSVIHSGETADGNRHMLELNLKLESNPAFTASIMVAFARAAVKLNREGKTGAFTPFDIPLCYLSDVPREQLIKNLL